MLSENQVAVISDKWLLRKDGEIVETIPDMFERVASAIAKNPFDKMLYKRYLSEFIFVPNTPTFIGAGTNLGQLSACFVLEIKDDMGKETNGIFDTLRQAALIQQSGGGVGFDFSTLRPKGAIVKSSGGYATGPIGFMRVFNHAFDEISQGGVRRSANIAILRVDHPDIFDFIMCKSKDGELSNFNNSVAITDKFMEAVANDANFDLVFAGKVYQTVKARSIMEAIVNNAWLNGDPGIIFIDTINLDNPFPGLRRYITVNPCGEKPLHFNESCNLMHINLTHYIENGKMQWYKLAQDVMLAVKMLNDILDANKFIPALPKLKQTALDFRGIGLGIIGFADLLFALKIRYGSEKGIAFAYQLEEFIRYFAMLSSVGLAIKDGPFPAINESIYAKDNFQFELHDKPDWIMDYDFARPVLDWQNLIAQIKMHGIRNSTLLTVAPTGTTATAAGIEGYGCEPVFALAYKRLMNLQNGDKKEMYYTSKALQQYDLPENIIKQIQMLGSLQQLDVSAELKEVFVTASDITPEQHVKMQAAFQVWNDSSISKTVNLPSSATKEDVRRVYELAYKLGCKGVTVYRNQSRQNQVLEVCTTCDANPMPGFNLI